MLSKVSILHGFSFKFFLNFWGDDLSWVWAVFDACWTSKGLYLKCIICLGMIWGVSLSFGRLKMVEKRVLGKNSRAGTYRHFAGTYLLEFLGFPRGSSMQVRTYAGFSAFGCRLMRLRYPNTLGLIGVGYGGL